MAKFIKRNGMVVGNKTLFYYNTPEGVDFVMHNHLTSVYHMPYIFNRIYD